MTTFQQQVKIDYDQRVSAELKQLFEKRDGGHLLAERLNDKIKDEDVITKQDNSTQLTWQSIGLMLFALGRHQESIDIFYTLYKKMLRWQITNNKWTHKAMPLVWISDNFRQLGYITLAKKFAMLTLVEDSIRDHSESKNLNIDGGGIYFRLKHLYGMSHSDILKYSIQYFDNFDASNPITLFPDYLLLQTDREWATEYPSSAEFTFYLINSEYLAFLKTKLSDGTGTALEHIAEHIMFSMPGCRTERRVQQFKNTTDYDIICSIDGPISDFRSELGRYIICECKDWSSPVDFSTISKFSRILISTKTKFGVLFSKKGITGAGTEKYASREHKKVFQDSNIIIAVIDELDIDEIINGKNLIGLLRTKYEYVRLDK